jgi:hypothetical protein
LPFEFLELIGNIQALSYFGDVPRIPEQVKRDLIRAVATVQDIRRVGVVGKSILVEGPASPTSATGALQKRKSLIHRSGFQKVGTTPLVFLLGR